ncbi:protein sco1 [Neurospora tetrasperma FGSC 2508]|uniref:Protein sco1 n=1 Tax=Neurospora tetrasperma (strain FGSC 2508 / ATCC MYA-4615 / P0657) TaxID=510951 RepID=F8N3Z0_NEUT8|nr:protein sco1 [Neurospora tetrasperma FGSC 2508]EGO52637.1 protein sco1 [Neurospora tetrasperma FGSC 2508]
MNMSHVIAPMRTFSSVLSRTPARQCQRFISTATTTRPTVPRLQAQLHQPVAQRRTYKTVEEAKSKYRSGPFSWKAGLLFVLTGAGLLWYFEHEKQRMQRKRIADATKGVGRPKVGGPFELIDQNGKPVTEKDLKGRYSLVYFGFSHCPDICPEELDKMAAMFEKVEAERPGALKPVFVTCDPARDTPQVLKEYLAEFHPLFIGLTGTYDQIKAMCKAYRVYFSTPSKVEPGQDYLVDHSIYFYLMDPEGDFVEALGRQHSPDQAAKVILDHMKDWQEYEPRSLATLQLQANL